MENRIGEPKIRCPKEPVKAGEPFLVKARVNHPMESGRRKDEAGNLIPIHHIRSMKVEYLGEEVMNAQITGGVSKNPYCTFWVVASQSGIVKVTWEDTKGGIFVGEGTVQVA